MTTTRYPIHIRFNDLDTYGIVNNAVYITYFEEGRKLWFQDRVGKKWDWQRNGILLVRHEVDYLLPLTLNDDVEIALHIGEIGRKSFEIIYTLYKRHEGDWTVCTRGKSVIVCYDYQQKRTVEVPQTWREVFLEP